eukprot:COSAG02_NODE_46264_length_350_cov_0.916335_1_plen_28_part_10
MYMRSVGDLMIARLRRGMQCRVAESIAA